MKQSKRDELLGYTYNNDRLYEASIAAVRLVHAAQGGQDVDPFLMDIYEHTQFVDRLIKQSQSDLREAMQENAVLVQNWPIDHDLPD